MIKFIKYLIIYFAIFLTSCAENVPYKEENGQALYRHFEFNREREEYSEGYFDDDSIPVGWVRIYDKNRKLKKMFDCAFFDNNLVTNNIIFFDSLGKIDYSKSEYVSICNLDRRYNKATKQYEITFDLKFNVTLKDTVFFIYGDLDQKDSEDSFIDTVPDIRSERIRIKYTGKYPQVRGRLSFGKIELLKNGAKNMFGGDLLVTIPSISMACMDSLVSF